MKRQDAPIDRLRAVPVEGTEATFILVDKETGEPFDVAGKIAEAYNAGCMREGK